VTDEGKPILQTDLKFETLWSKISRSSAQLRWAPRSHAGAQGNRWGASKCALVYVVARVHTMGELRRAWACRVRACVGTCVCVWLCPEAPVDQSFISVLKFDAVMAGWLFIAMHVGCFLKRNVLSRRD